MPRNSTATGSGSFARCFDNRPVPAGEKIVSAAVTATGTLTAATCEKATGSGRATVTWKRADGSTTASEVDAGGAGNIAVAGITGKVVNGEFRDSTVVAFLTGVENLKDVLRACGSSEGLTKITGGVVGAIVR